MTIISFLTILWQRPLPQDIISFIAYQCLLGGGGLVYLYRNEIRVICEKYSRIVLVAVLLFRLHVTSFDSIALTVSCYSYHTLNDGEQPNKGIQLMWCILLILLPIALLFAESSMNNLQSVSIVAAFPIGAVIVMIAVSFMKDAKKYMESLEDKG